MNGIERINCDSEKSVSWQYLLYRFRSKKAKHCAICQKCIRGFDHHCRWLNNCIGERNYRFVKSFILYSNFWFPFILENYQILWIESEPKMIRTLFCDCLQTIHPDVGISDSSLLIYAGLLYSPCCSVLHGRSNGKWNHFLSRWVNCTLPTTQSLQTLTLKSAVTQCSVKYLWKRRRRYKRTCPVKVHLKSSVVSRKGSLC